MKNIRNSKYDSVLDEVEKTYPNYSLCSYENLGRITGKLEITNPSRFWNERCREMLQAINDINVIFHRYPDSYKSKMLVSPQFQGFFHSQLFPYLSPKIQDQKNASSEDTAMMIKICSNFLQIGLSGILKSMPSDFTHILEPKIQEIFSLMEAINQYTNRIAPNYSKSTNFPFDLYAKYT
jgi:hypothetical protein